MYASAAAHSCSSASQDVSTSSAVTTGEQQNKQSTAQISKRAKSEKAVGAAETGAPKVKKSRNSLQIPANFVLFANVKCADPSTLPFKPITTWTKIEAMRWFDYCKKAPCKTEIYERLTLLAACHPSHAQYAKGQLASTVELWADMFKVWEFTQGAQYSTVAEHWFRSIMHLMKKETVPLFGILETMRRVVKRREAVTYTRKDVRIERVALEALITMLEGQGLKKSLRALMVYILPNPNDSQGPKDTRKRAGLATLFRILEVMKNACEYRSQGPIDLLDDATFKAAGYERPDASAVRFCKLLSNRVVISEPLARRDVFKGHKQPQLHVPGRLYLVRRKAGEEGERGHLILLCQGGIVCDCVSFHQYGHWCRHAFALLMENKLSSHVSLAIDRSYADARHRRGDGPDLGPEQVLVGPP